MQIAIDGPAGAGKSTIAKIIAERTGILYLDTGAMYRAITYGALKAGIDWQDQQSIIDIAANSRITFDQNRVILNGEDITEAIRMPEVSKHTSDVAVISEVREILVNEQRRIAAGTSVIMDGRDIGSVVLPDADYKFYLDATVRERAQRRLKEFEDKGLTKTLQEVERDIAQRDYNDMHRKAGPLVCVPDAVVIDTTGKDISTVCQEITAYFSRESEK